MYLKRLELQGFKSFADKTKLDFMSGITTVIGPNGSGKSNISDSIRWVLGEQSMKSLRGSKSEDVIFAGTESRKSLGFAEASIIIDNSDGKLPIEFSEVTVTRRTYRSGETGYYINKTPCRLKDILELFMDTGIGKDGYSIIGQGKIDEILSNKSEDRRHVFEEAAGIIKYRTRKMESEKKLEQTRVNLLRINDILSEIEANIEPLKAQSEKAKKFLNLRDQLREIEIGLFLYNLETNKVKLEKIGEDLNIILTQQETENTKLSTLQDLKEQLKNEIDEIINKIEETQNLGFESTNKIEKINSDISVTKEKIANNEANFDKYLQDIESSKEKVKSLEEEKTARIEKKSNLSLNKEKFANELLEKEKELEIVVQKLSQEELQIEEKKRKVEQDLELKYEKKEAVNTAETNIDNLKKREKIVETEISDTISKLDEKRLVKSEIMKSFNGKEKIKNEQNTKLEEVTKRKNEATTNIDNYNDKINNLTSELRVKKSKKDFLEEMEREKEGYQRSVKALLLECDKNTSLSKKMHGVLANLIAVPKEYETAIEMVLGATLQNVVTQTEEDAKKLIEHLRENNLGRASFLPISSVKGKKVDKLIRNNLSGVIGIASDLVKSDKKYESILLNLLGRTVVVDNIDTAIILARQNSYSFRIVTLKGDIINPSGAMTGGSVTQKSSNIIGRATQIKEIEKDIEKLEKIILKVTEEKEQYEKSIGGIFEEINSIEQLIQNFEIEYATEKQRVISVEETITSLEAKLQKLREEKIGIQAEQEENSKVKEENASLIIEIEKESDLLTLDIQAFSERNKENQKYIDDLNFDITNLKISVSSFDESKNSIDEILSRIDEEIKTNTDNILAKTAERENIIIINKELENTVQDLNNKIEEIKNSVLTSDTQIDELKKLRAEKNSILNDTENNINEQHSLIENLRNEENKLNIKKSKIDGDIEQIINQMWEDYNLTPNTVQEYKKPDNVQTQTKQLNTIKEEIKSLGNVNVDSIEEYKQTKERYDFMCEQRLDLEDSMAKLKKVIFDMTKIMKEQFLQKFKIINKNFGEVFQELFGGGKAELILTDTENVLECGIDIEVQPPGKKLQNMTLLSGGERAFTAIALLFAILKINPAPFCVLDEIEAALDEANVYRFAEYLKKFSKNTQFLVITHRKGTMEAANSVYGITMEEKGISKMISMKF